MATVGDLATRFGVSPQTLRNWCEEYGAEFLSGDATPAAGHARDFKPEDVRVLAFIHSKNPRVIGHEPVKAALRAGEHEALELEEEPETIDASGTGTGLSLQKMTAVLGEQQGVIRMLTEERDRLYRELQEERQKQTKLLVDAQRVQQSEEDKASLREELQASQQRERESLERAVRAETELEVLQRPQSASARAADRWTVAEEPAKPKSWWQRLTGKR